MKHASLLAALATGCAAPVVGEWRTPEDMSFFGDVEAPNRLTLGSDQTGKANVFYTLNGDGIAHSDRFEVTWEEDTATSFPMKLRCFASDTVPLPCTSHDTALDCAIDSEPATGEQASALTCSGEGFWLGYAFVFEAVSPDE